MHVNVTVDISPGTVQAVREILRKNVYRAWYHFMIGTSLYKAFASTICIIMSKLRLVNLHARHVESFPRSTLSLVEIYGRVARYRCGYRTPTYFPLQIADILCRTNHYLLCIFCEMCYVAQWNCERKRVAKYVGTVVYILYILPVDSDLE